MKKLMTVGLLALMTTSSFAAEFSCKADYINKMAWSVGRTGVGGILTVGAGTGAVLGTAAAIVTGSTIGMAPVLGVGVLGGYTYYEANKLEAYLTAHDVIDEALTPNGLEVAREKIITQEKARLQKKLNDKLNPERRRLNQEELTLEQFLEANPIRVARTPLEEMVFQANRKLREDITYEQAVEMIKEKAEDKSFCENNNPMGKRKLKKFLVSLAKNQDLSVNQSDRNEVKEVDEETESAPEVVPASSVQ